MLYKTLSLPCGTKNVSVNLCWIFSEEKYNNCITILEIKTEWIQALQPYFGGQVNISVYI